MRIIQSEIFIQPKDCIVFEDSIPGITAARNAGMFVVGVATTHTPEELNLYVNKILVNFEKAPEIIDNWLVETGNKK